MGALARGWYFSSRSPNISCGFIVDTEGQKSASNGDHIYRYHVSHSRLRLCAVSEHTSRYSYSLTYLATAKVIQSTETTSVIGTQPTAVSQLNQLIQRYTKTLLIQCFTEQDELAPPETAWSCSFSVNGDIKAKAVGKSSKKEAMEAAAGEALDFLAELGYK